MQSNDELQLFFQFRPSFGNKLMMKRLFTRGLARLKEHSKRFGVIEKMSKTTLSFTRRTIISKFIDVLSLGKAGYKFFSLLSVLDITCIFGRLRAR